MLLMKSSSYILIMCFFMHACNARIRLGLATSKFPLDKIDHQEKLRVSMNFISPNSKDTTIDKTIPTISSKPKEEEALCKKHKDNKGANSGSEDCKSSLHKASKNATKSEGSRRPRLYVREKVLHSSFFSDEDIFETDYQPPQHKSPIHNK